MIVIIFSTAVITTTMVVSSSVPLNVQVSGYLLDY